MKGKKAKKLAFRTFIVLAMQTIVSITIMFGMNSLVLAATPSPGLATESFSVGKYLKAKDQGQIYLKTDNPLASFIIQVVNFLVLTIGSVCFIAIVIGGFVLLTSHGNENQLTKGKDIITLAVVGLVIVLTSYFITAFVQSLFYELPGK